MDQESAQQHEKRLHHATAAWASAMAALSDPQPEADHRSSSSSTAPHDDRQLAEHATKLLSLPLLCIGQLPGRLRDATIAQIVRMYADCTAYLQHHPEVVDTERQQLVRDVGTWCAWALSQSMQQPAIVSTESPQATSRDAVGRPGAHSHVPLRGEHEMVLTLEGARNLMAHFGIGAVDWAKLLAAEGANALAHHLPQCDAACLSAIALESLPGMGHQAAMPAIEELVAHCCRTALKLQKQQPPPHGQPHADESSLLDSMLPMRFQAALFADAGDGDAICSLRPFDLLRNKTKLLWWRLRHETFSDHVVQLARRACTQYPYGSATHTIIDMWARDSDMSLPDSQRNARSPFLQQVQEIAECSVFWRPLFTHAVDVLLQLLHDTGAPIAGSVHLVSQTAANLKSSGCRGRASRDPGRAGRAGRCACCKLAKAGGAVADFEKFLWMAYEHEECTEWTAAGPSNGQATNRIPRAFVGNDSGSAAVEDVAATGAAAAAATAAATAIEAKENTADRGRNRFSE
eukprot:COSAG02_NODE_2967_length_7641_cov_10.730708_2_plen_518_part_00